MTRPPLPCRYYNTPKGCHHGGRCKFLHTTDTKETQNLSRPSSSASPAPRSPPNASTRRPTSPSPPLPRGVCRFYWENGSCKREFDCRFEHTYKTQTRSTARLTVTSQAAEDLIAPFLTEKGLAKINGSGTDGFFAHTNSTSLSPTEAHSRLKRFLLDNFKFHTALQVYGFLILLSSANSANSLWVSLNFAMSTSTQSCFFFSDSRRRPGALIILFVGHVFIR
jgi:hypothetical protein